jgi:Tol biopolymer transport system component
MRLFRFIVFGIGLIFLLAACGGPVSAPQPTPDVNVIVSQTMQALTAAAPEATQPASTSTPSLLPLSLLPRTLYFLNTDAAAHLQIFRLGADGKTLTQITYELADVVSYDVNQNDGRVIYISNNQMLLINADGSGRQVIFDGGQTNTDSPYLTDIQNAVWSPNGETIAYGYHGLNLYAIATGASNHVLENQIQDMGNGFMLPAELYRPEAFSPDGSKLLISLGYMEGGTFAVYYPSNNTLVRLTQPETGGVCCGARWTPDSNALYAALATTGMYSSGLWRIDVASGKVTTLLPGDAGNGSINFADAPQIGPDGQLYFFFASTPPGSEFVGSAPLQLVRSAPDGISGRTVLLPDTFARINEALWSPYMDLVIVAIPQNDQTWQGGQAEIIYTDGRPRVVLVPFAQSMKWGPQPGS